MDLLKPCIQYLGLYIKFRLYQSPWKEELYKDIGKHSHFKAKNFFITSMLLCSEHVSAQIIRNEFNLHLCYTIWYLKCLTSIYFNMVLPVTSIPLIRFTTSLSFDNILRTNSFTLSTNSSSISAKKKQQNKRLYLLMSFVDFVSGLYSH